MGWLTPDVLKVGAPGLLALVFIAMLLGWILPKSVANRMAATAQANAEMWRGIAERQTERADLAAKQSGELLEGMETIEKLVRSIAPPPKGTR